MLTATFPFWAAVAFSFVVITAFNIYAERQGIGSGIFNYAITLMFLIAFVVYYLLIVLGFGVVRRWIARERR